MKMKKVHEVSFGKNGGQPPVFYSWSIQYIIYVYSNEKRKFS